jgi:4-hydroxy-tetrahydrodipicolinate synthase
VGTTGESPTLSHDEHERVIGAVVESAAGRIKVMPGTGSNSTAEALRLTRFAAKVGADAALVVAPYYNKPTQAGLLVHFGAVADALPGFPIVLYNVPGRTASNIAAPTVLALAARHDNIVAVKEASGDFSQIMAILKDRPEGFRVLAGDDAVTLPLVALGADGIISVVSNEAPDLMTRLADLALAGDFAAARALHYRLLPLMEANFIESNPGPVKAVMALQGLLEEHLRPPLVPVQEETRARLREVLGAVGLLEKAARHAVA